VRSHWMKKGQTSLIYEKAFQASARVMNAMDEVLDTIINRMGLGRTLRCASLQKNIQRAYLNNLHRNMKQLATSNERMSSGRRLNRVSDNVSDAQRALTVRDKLQRSEQYLRNIDKLQLDLNGQETSLMQMNEIIDPCTKFVGSMRRAIPMGRVNDRFLRKNSITSVRASFN